MRRLASLVLATGMALLAWDANEDLLTAARTGDLASVRALVAKGAALEAKTSYGQTPLYLASMNGHADVVAFLLEKGANTGVQDTFYKAPILAFVLQRKHYGIAKMLIAKGAGTVDENLTAVAEIGDVGLAQAVLDKGKPSQQSLDKSYEIALQKKQTELADLLKSAGAQPPAPPAEVDPKVLESYIGSYHSEQFPLDIKIFLKEGKLYMQAAGQPEFLPKAKSPTIFEYAAAKLEVEFTSATTFTLKQIGREFKYNKVAPQ